MKIHIVQKGDTIWEIAEHYGVNFEELKQLNSHISSPDMIMPGMKIKIPTTSKNVKTKEQLDKEKTKQNTEQKDIVTKEKTKKEQQPQPKPNTMPLKPLQQPQLGDQFLTVQPKTEAPKTTEQQHIPKIKQQTPHKMQPKPEKNYIKQQMPIQQGNHIPKQPMPSYPVQPHMVNPMPVYPNFHSPCCCPCMMQQPYLPHMNKTPKQLHHYGNETYVFNKK